jgi:hypothetical protein
VTAHTAESQSTITYIATNIMAATRARLARSPFRHLAKFNVAVLNALADDDAAVEVLPADWACRTSQSYHRRYKLHILTVLVTVVVD